MKKKKKFSLFAHISPVQPTSQIHFSFEHLPWPEHLLSQTLELQFVPSHPGKQLQVGFFFFFFSRIRIKNKNKNDLNITNFYSIKIKILTLSFIIQFPLLEQESGQRFFVQVSPDQPASQAQEAPVDVETHLPWPPQPFVHIATEQFFPIQPLLHWQTSSLQVPWPEHLFGQGRILQSAPDQPRLQVHF